MVEFQLNMAGIGWEFRDEAAGRRNDSAHQVHPGGHASREVRDFGRQRSLLRPRARPAGSWASAPSLEECREELQEVVKESIMLSIAQHDPLPIIDGIELQATLVV